MCVSAGGCTESNSYKKKLNIGNSKINSLLGRTGRGAKCSGAAAKKRPKTGGLKPR